MAARRTLLRLRPEGAAGGIGQQGGHGGYRGDEDGNVHQNRQIAADSGFPSQLANAGRIAEGFHGYGGAKRHAHRNRPERYDFRRRGGPELPRRRKSRSEEHTSEL